MVIRFLFISIFLIGFSVAAQDTHKPVEVDSIENDTLQKKYMIIAGDSIPREAIDLEEVVLLRKLKFDSNTDRKRYLILRRKTRKVYPYAKLASERLIELNSRLDDIKSKRAQKKYTKIVQNYIEEEFSVELKKLTRTEGQILVKLIHRQTGITTFDLVKELKSGWRAFWYNTTASMFDISLKEEYHPESDQEDFLIEDILQRSFRDNILERQASALDFEYLDLSDKWNNRNSTKKRTK
ncbi:DUF4294 domain-containing protein [Christiangramia forsetii]|uniref:DUF4294 domain-containing protein n=2 Tax=Christiangramia forsetii TaxID=411153 RepID=A0M2M1_CHRFK|nr:DUF4294 domain-containing protein [Christiangramia forsetii]GGG44008.1 hypothetical protein GCM10011532_30070 [Christiangramia forsetii]CAL66866.1 conserved hypothetical protein, secreted [Christiangramia forsetii KT0803]